MGQLLDGGEWEGGELLPSAEMAWKLGSELGSAKPGLHAPQGDPAAGGRVERQDLALDHADAPQSGGPVRRPLQRALAQPPAGRRSSAAWPDTQAGQPESSAPWCLGSPS